MSKPDWISTNLMLLLSFGTGVLDAATYLGLHGVFTANMTGNVVFVGLGLAGGEEVPLFRAALALAGFVVGAAVIGLVQRGRAVVSRNTDVIAAVTFLLTALLVGGTAAGLYLVDASELVLDLLTAVIAGAMGAQTVAARRVGVADVSTVVVTSTLAGFAAESPWTGKVANGRATFRRLSAVLTMGVGAVVGALLLKLGIAVPVALTGGILLLVGLLCMARVVRARRRTSARALQEEELTTAG